MTAIFLYLSLMIFSPNVLNSLSVSAPNTPPSEKVFTHFFGLLFEEERAAKEDHLKFIAAHWEPSFAIMVLDICYVSQDPYLNSSLFQLLRKKTGVNFGSDFDAWYEWLWNRDQQILPDYGDFKGKLYALIDPKFEKYFENRTAGSKIRLDEVRWGGVKQDGIPPLRKPKMITAEAAKYLGNQNVVFGIELNGDVRAYPKRILAWHEMFVDEVGGIPVAGVYCTLCGTVILYETQSQGKQFTLGTSGFLYRSNKLMYDKKTQSLWNTILGEPVIGPLVDKGISLPSHSVVTTTWGEWKKRHPNTKVLSLNTGHNRNYDEGIAYQSYFSTDDLMFTVPRLDQRLKNKDEVLIIRPDGFKKDPLAISAKFLAKKPIYHDKIGTTSFVVFTDKSGGNRVYETKGHLFTSFDRKTMAIDSKGIQWTISEEALTSTNGQTLKRLPYHRAFWFGWYANYPDTRLVL